MARLVKYSPTPNGTMVPDENGNWYFVEETAPLLVEEKFTASNKQSDAITLWKEFVVASTHGYPVSWVQANGTRINAVVA